MTTYHRRLTSNIIKKHTEVKSWCTNWELYADKTILPLSCRCICVVIVSPTDSMTEKETHQLWNVRLILLLIRRLWRCLRHLWLLVHLLLLTLLLELLLSLMLLVLLLL